MIFVRIQHGLPAESALAIDENGGKWPWTLTEHLLADVWFEARIARLGKKAKDHPGRPKTKRQHTEMSPAKAAKLRSARRRARKRREAQRNRNQHRQED